MVLHTFRTLHVQVLQDRHGLESVLTSARQCLVDPSCQNGPPQCKLYVVAGWAREPEPPQWFAAQSRLHSMIRCVASREGQSVLLPTGWSSGTRRWLHVYPVWGCSACGVQTAASLFPLQGPSPGQGCRLTAVCVQGWLLTVYLPLDCTVPVD